MRGVCVGGCLSGDMIGLEESGGRGARRLAVFRVGPRDCATNQRHTPRSLAPLRQVGLPKSRQHMSHGRQGQSTLGDTR